jgi:hypothetical protein
MIFYQIIDFLIIKFRSHPTAGRIGIVRTPLIIIRLVAFAVQHCWLVEFYCPVTLHIIGCVVELVLINLRVKSMVLWILVGRFRWLNVDFVTFSNRFVQIVLYKMVSLVKLVDLELRHQSTSLFFVLLNGAIYWLFLRNCLDCLDVIAHYFGSLLELMLVLLRKPFICFVYFFALQLVKIVSDHFVTY